jgi:hypothetical protein
MDMIYLGVSLAFFAVTLGFVRVCAALKGEDR